MSSIKAHARRLGLDTDSLQRTIRENRFVYLLFAPTFLFILTLLWLPFIRGLWISFHEWPSLGPKSWVGLGNYVELLTWDIFFTSLEATVVFMSATILQVAIGVIAAVALVDAKLGRWKSIIASIFLIGYSMPPVVTGTIWKYLLLPNFGPVLQGLVDMGIIDQQIYWGTNGPSALAVVTGVAVWTYWPFVFLLVYATRRSVPEEYYETAKIYGMGTWQTFRRITFPQIKSAILVALSLRIVWNFAKVSQPFAMTSGGPGYETSVLAILMYRLAWRQGQLGQAYAVGVVIVILGMLAVFLFIREFEREDAGGEST